MTTLSYCSLQLLIELREIDRCIKKIINSKHDSLISLCGLNSCHPIKMKKIKGNLVKNYIKNTAEESKSSRT